MTSRDFVYWLQGYFEILDPKGQSGAIPFSAQQSQCVREHLQLVFQHMKPEVPQPAPATPPIDWLKTYPFTGGGGAVVC